MHFLRGSTRRIWKLCHGKMPPVPQAQRKQDQHACCTQEKQGDYRNRCWLLGVHCIPYSISANDGLPHRCQCFPTSLFCNGSHDNSVCLYVYSMAEKGPEGKLVTGRRIDNQSFLP